VVGESAGGCLEFGVLDVKVLIQGLEYPESGAQHRLGVSHVRGAAATEAASRLLALDGSEHELARALAGREHPEWKETSPSFWDDPLTPAHLRRATARKEHFRQARLNAEDALEHRWVPSG
jgi:hypothetical protein